MYIEVAPSFEGSWVKRGSNDGDLVAGTVQRDGFAIDSVIEVQVGKGDHTNVHGESGAVDGN